MPDELDRLAAKLMEDAAATTDKFKALAVKAGMSTDEALTKLAMMFRNIAANHLAKS